MNNQPSHRLFTALFTLVFAGIVVVAVAYSGLVNVAATSRPSALTQWLLTTTRDHSIASRSKTIALANLTSAARIGSGGQRYREMCQGCHGGPGVGRDAIGEGLDPQPPALWTGALDDEGVRETFWVVKNGIRMTGMPSFGPTHDDEKIWDIVAFVGKMHGMSSVDYAAATQRPVTAQATRHDGTQEQHPVAPP